MDISNLYTLEFICIDKTFEITFKKRGRKSGLGLPWFPYIPLLKGRYRGLNALASEPWIKAGGGGRGVAR